MKIEKTLIIDAHHLCKEMIKLLESNRKFLDNSGYHTMNVYNTQLGKGLWPQDMTALTELAEEHECAYIKFEKDGEVIEGLRTFKW